MPPSETALTTKVQSGSPYQLDPSQTLKAAEALCKHVKATKAQSETKTGAKSLLAQDADEVDSETEDAVEDDEPIWLVLTTKKHITDKKRLKPGKIPLPHSLHTSQNLRICLITADPQRAYKDLIAEPSFPSDLAPRISRVIGVSKLKAKWKSYESRRALLAEHDVFMADDRIVTYLPQILGKIFYKGGSKRPIPVCLQGYEKKTPAERKSKSKSDKTSEAMGTPIQVASEIKKALQSALVHISPSATTSVKVAKAHWSPENVRENVDVVVKNLVEKYIPKGWRNIRSLHIKGPNTAALPIWLADELWADEEDVLDEKFVAPEREGKKLKGEGKKRKLLEVEAPQPEQKKQRADKEKDKEGADIAKEVALRKEKLRKQKAKVDDGGAEVSKSKKRSKRSEDREGVSTRKKAKKSKVVAA